MGSIGVKKQIKYTDMPFAQVLSDYDRYEPMDSDRWNPRYKDKELNCRLSLFREVTLALRASEIVLSKQKILDVGCSNGRTCRMYLDLGFMPNQITGIDIRQGPVLFARKLHSGIKAIFCNEAELPFPDNSFTWISLCGVMSSIRKIKERDLLVSELCRILAPDGFLFFWDLKYSVPFAGSVLLIPKSLFPKIFPVFVKQVSLYGGFDDLTMRQRIRCILKLLLHPCLKKTTHQSALFWKRPS